MQLISRLNHVQAVKNQSQAAYLHSRASGQLDRHQRLAEREGSSQLLQEWVADMKAAELKHISPSLTALVQVRFAALSGLLVCQSVLKCLTFDTATLEQHVLHPFCAKQHYAV